jgi:hypothetical protein
VLALALALALAKAWNHPEESQDPTLEELPKALRGELPPYFPPLREVDP